MLQAWNLHQNRRFFILFFLALGLRLISLIQQSINNPLFDYPVVDAEVYSQWADEIVSGKWWWPELRNYLPVYPWFLAICKWLFWGDNAWGVKIVQSLLSSTACVLLAKTTERAFDKVTGFIAGLLFASNWMFILYDGERFSESFSLSMLVFGLYLLSGKLRWWRIILSAVFSSLAAACRPNLIPLLLVCAGWIYFSQPKENRKIIPSTLFLFIASLLFLPVLYHNHSLSGKWILRAQQNWNFYVAIDPTMGGLSPAAGIEFDKYMLKPVLQGHYSHEAQDAYWGRETIRLIQNQPVAVIKNFFFDRGMVFLSATEWSQEIDVYAFRKYSSLLSLPLPGFGWIFPLGLLGLMGVIKNKKVPSPVGSLQRFLLICLITATCFTFISKVTGRYRFPIVLFLIPFAAIGLPRILGYLAGKRIGWITIFLLVGAFSWVDWTNLSHRQTAMHLFYIGQKYQKLGQLENADRSFREETSKQPWNANAPNELARVLWRKNQIPEALTLVSFAIQREPEFWSAWTLKGSLEIEQKQYEKAAASLDRSLAIFPMQAEPWMLKQQIFMETGNWKQEEEAFQNGIKYGANPPFIISYALRLEDKGFYAEALKQFQGIATNPSEDEAYRARAFILAAYLFFIDLQREDRARECWKKVRSELSRTHSLSDQAGFLLGEIPEDEYRRRIESAPRALAFYDFDRGLRFLMNHDYAKATEAFQNCLANKQLSAKSPKPISVPEKWAWKFLQESPKVPQK